LGGRAESGPIVANPRIYGAIRQFLPDRERHLRSGQTVAETRSCDVQGLSAMELGGFEPPTSWVRFTPLATHNLLESSMRSGFAAARDSLPTEPDMRGYAAIVGGVQAETLISARSGPGGFNSPSSLISVRGRPRAPTGLR
jgi:hypothetical protein